MRPTRYFLKLHENYYKEHGAIELDGLPCLLKDLQERYYDGCLVRIGKHLYMDRKSLTEGAPSWDSLWIDDGQ